VFVTQCGEIITHEIHFVQEQWLWRNLCDEDTESKLICDIDSDEYVEDMESDEDEDYYDEEDYGDEEKQPSLSVQQKQIMKWRMWSQVDHTHVHGFTGSARPERSRMKHSILIMIHRF
jgi:hypothetical protein